jgi:hypothetical protein
MKDKSKQRFSNKCAKKLDIPVPRDHPEYWSYYKQLRQERVQSAHDKYSREKRELRNEQWRNWASQNKDKIRAKNALARAEKIQRCPAWADKKAIEDFYKNCPEGYHVDHIIPLKGKNVSGLHVLENLQYLSAKENMSKSNKFLTNEV